ncbi:YwhD family protein [Ferviditalea candida]|uniref:YwhD family protein n=1 Tax=Ferviditalea candida TaxID=3108399 RepID=A0ABU5ZHA0_9BACL|nr:YwhD family protein [Paenibacillaceae bacterium T2]
MDVNQDGGKKLSLNVVSGKKNHRGFGAGMIDLSNLSSVIIDGEEAYIDVGALHAKSKIEKGIKFSPNKEEVPNGRRCWIVWVAVDRTEEGAHYAGVTACEMLIDTEQKKGWKILVDHVNRMESALKRRYLLDGLNDTERAALKKLLMEHNEQWWERSPEELKEKLD